MYAWFCISFDSIHIYSGVGALIAGYWLPKITEKRMEHLVLRDFVRLYPSEFNSITNLSHKALNTKRTRFREEKNENQNPSTSAEHSNRTWLWFISHLSLYDTSDLELANANGMCALTPFTRFLSLSKRNFPETMRRDRFFVSLFVFVFNTAKYGNW